MVVDSASRNLAIEAKKGRAGTGCCTLYFVNVTGNVYVTRDSTQV
jgi:hypothetical protein